MTTEGRSALLYAASKGREEIVRFLMAKVILLLIGQINLKSYLSGGRREQS